VPLAEQPLLRVAADVAAAGVELAGNTDAYQHCTSAYTSEGRSAPQHGLMLDLQHPAAH